MLGAGLNYMIVLIGVVDGMMCYVSRDVRGLPA